MMAFETETAFWNRRYALGLDSGEGSYGVQMLRKVDHLAALDGVDSIAEIGCGDFNFGKHLTDRLPTVRYAGADISDIIIAQNQKAFRRSTPRITFSYGTECPLQQPDLLLCMDVLFHIQEDADYDHLLAQLKADWHRYLALTAYEYDGLRAHHVHIRKFDPELFGTPILREVCEEDGSKMFYIFKK